MAALEGAVEPSVPSLHAVSEAMPVQEVLLDELPSEESVKPAASITAADIVAKRMKNLPHELRHAAEPASRPESEVVGKARTDVQRDAEEARYEQTNLSPDYTFDTLVEGMGSRLAAAAAQALAESQGQSYNPFFLYDITGSGKTHLVQAVGNELLKIRPDAKVRYMHSDDYIRSFMKAVRNNTYDVFKQQYKQYDLLIIDDIQFIKGKDCTHGRVFLSVQPFPQREKTADPHLRCVSRENRRHRRPPQIPFSWGLTLELEPPELEMRIAILQKKAEAAGISIEDEAALFIANLIRSSVRELEGAFNRVGAISRFMNRPVIDIDLARTALQDIIAE